MEAIPGLDDWYTEPDPEHSGRDPYKEREEYEERTWEDKYDDD